MCVFLLSFFTDCVWFCSSTPTFAFLRGLSCDSFCAAASMDLAAVRSSLSAITVGSSGSTQSVPDKVREQRIKGLKPLTGRQNHGLESTQWQNDP